MAVVLEKVADDVFRGYVYEPLLFTGFACYVGALFVGSFRLPVPALFLALAAAFLMPHQDCGMSIGVLPGMSIVPSWMIGSLCHVIRRAIRARK